MRAELPVGWALATFGDAVETVRGVTFSSSEKLREPTASSVLCLRTSNVQDELQWGDILHIDQRHVRRDDQWLRNEDIVISMANSYELVGKVAIADPIPSKSTFGGFLAVLRSRKIFQKYLFYWLRTNVAQTLLRDTSSQSVNIANLSIKGMNEIHFPVAPLAEQRRIVAKLEALLAKVDASRKRLERIPVILKRFRQAVLAAACDGRLTEDWREEHPECRIGDSYLQLQSDDSITGLPPSWLACHVGDALRLKNGFAFKSTDYSTEGIPVVRISNIQNGKVDIADCVKIPKDKANWNFVVEDGDLLVAMSGATTGKFGIYYGNSKCLQNQRVGNIKIINQNLVTSEYRNFALLTLQKQIEIDAYGGAQPNISPEKIEALPFACPPLSEQHEIVVRVGNLFALADQIEARYAKAKAQVDRLTQSILAKAFRGELVPQDPNDEPADALLSRLGAAPAEASAPARRRGRPPRVQPAAPPVAPAPPVVDRETPALADLTPEAILQAHREVLASIPSPLSEDNLLRAVALRLGFQRLGGRIKARIREAIGSRRFI